MLGTNDARPVNWKGEAPFKKDYLELVRTFMNMSSKPEVHVMVPTPKYYKGAVQNTVNYIFPKLIPELA